MRQSEAFLRTQYRVRLAAMAQLELGVHQPEVAEPVFAVPEVPVVLPGAP